MKRFGIAVCALLLGAGAAVPTCATAAMPASALRAAAPESGLIHHVAAGARLRPPQDGFMLAQYGGGRDADDDPPQRNNNNNGGYQQPYQQPQQHRNNNNNNNNNGAAAAGAIINLLGNIAREKERARQQQQYNDRLRREQSQRNQEIKNKRAREQKERLLDKKREADRIRRIEEEKEREDARRDAEKKREPVYPPSNTPYQPATNQNQPQPDYQPAVTERDNNPYVDVDDNKNVINVVPAPDNCPDNFAQLRIGPTVLYPRRTDYPGDPSLCAGRTGKGCYLRVVNGPATCGGGRPVCVAYCGTPAPPPAIKRVDPTPTPIVTPPTKYVDDPKPVIVVPPPVVKVTEEAKKTGRATKYVEPKPAPVEAKKTGRATKYVEPKPAPVEAKKTVKAGEYTEPKPAPVEAKKTVKAGEYTEPKPAPVAAKKTAAAGPYVEPAHEDKPAEKTADKGPTPTEVAKLDPKPKPDEPENFEFDSVGDPPKDEQKKPPVKTAIAKPDPQTKKPGDPDNPDFGFDSVSIFNAPPPAQPDPPVDPCYAWVAARLNQPRDFLGDVLLNEPALRGMEASRRQYEEAARAAEAACKKKLADDASKKKEEERRRADDERKKKQRDALLNPVMDGKCTTEGAMPAAKLVRGLPLREIVIGGVSAIPAAATEGIPVGAIAGGVMKLFWKDDGPDQIFDQMKAYVDQMVPEAINSYDSDKLKKEIGDLKKLYRRYEVLKTPSTKGRWLEGLVRHLDGNESNFLDPRSPEKTIAEFVAFGSLKVAALQELIANYDKYVPFDPTNEDAKMQHEEDRTSFIQMMNDTIKGYTDHVAEVRKKIIDDRLSKLKIASRDYVETPSSPFGFMGLSDDLVDRMTFKKTRVEDTFCDWKGPEHDDDAAVTQADLDRRREAVRQTYNAILDTLLAPVSNWPSATPMAAPVRTADATPKR